MSETLQLESRGAAAVIRIVRPAARNALDGATLRALARTTRSLRRDPNCRGIVITGSGGIFVSGGDLREVAAVRTRLRARQLIAIGLDVMESVQASEVPVIAAINGDAFGGGCELAAWCDLRVADDGVRFHWVQNRLGVTTAWGGTSRLVRTVGPGTAARWLLAARAVPADEAARHGFVDELVPAGSCVDAACGWIEQVAAATTRATSRRQLQLIRGAMARDAEQQLAAEARSFVRAKLSKDHRDAIARTLERIGRGSGR